MNIFVQFVETKRLFDLIHIKCRILINSEALVIEKYPID